jgi:uncharacterized circularly permuted ATP-grasp superfamily protein
VERIIERWRLVRPTVDLRRTGLIAAEQKVDPAVGHLVQVLLNNLRAVAQPGVQDPTVVLMTPGAYNSA